MSTYHKIVSGLSFAEYKKHPGVNASFLKKFAISPAYAKNDTFEGSPATDLGSYVHALTIDRGTLENFACLPTTGEGSKTARAKWRDEHPDGVLLSPSAMETGKAAANALINYSPYAALMANDGLDTEVTLFTEHPKYGFPMKARLDILVNHNDTLIVGDIKTFGNPLTKKALYWAIQDRGYDLQFVHYRRCLQQILNRTPEEMAFYFQETETPGHDTLKVTLDEGWLAHAEHRLDEYYKQYNECFRTGHYPAVNNGQPLQLTLGEKV